MFCCVRDLRGAARGDPELDTGRGIDEDLPLLKYVPGEELLLLDCEIEACLLLGVKGKVRPLFFCRGRDLFCESGELGLLFAWLPGWLRDVLLDLDLGSALPGLDIEGDLLRK